MAAAIKAQAGHLLASSSANVKVWDFTAIEKGAVTLSQSLQAVAISWAPDNSSLAVATVNKLVSILFYSTSGDLQDTILLDITEGNGLRTMRVGEKGRTIWFAGDSRLVRCYDRTQKKVVSTFKGHTASITCLALNATNSHIASGSAFGQVLLFNTTTGVMTTFETSTTQEITDIQFSLFKKGLLAASCDDGVVRFWDTHSSTTPIFTFEAAHAGPIKGISFAPVNSVLFISAGLDKRIVLYNIDKRSVIKTINTPEPLTSLAFKPDNTMVAAGTLSGNILVYDLKSLSAPVYTLHANDDGRAVGSLAFQYHPMFTTRSSTPSAPKPVPPAATPPQIIPTPASTASSSQVPAAAPNTAVAKTNLPSSILDSSKPTNFLDMFSPLKSNSTPNITTSSSAKLSAESNMTPIVTPSVAVDTLSKKQTAASSIEAIKPTTTDVLLPKTTPLLSTVAASPSNLSLTTPAKRPSVQSQSFPAELDIFSPLAKKTVDQGSALVKTLPASLSETGTSKPPLIPESTLKSDQTDKKVPRHVVESPSDSVANSQSVPASQTIASAPIAPSTNISLANLPSITSDSAGPVGSLQASLLRSLIDEAMQSFRSSIHDDLQNMHLEMLRQFQIQQNELAAMIKKHSPTQEMLDELQQLREENRRLRHMY